MYSCIFVLRIKLCISIMSFYKNMTYKYYLSIQLCFFRLLLNFFVLR